MKVNKIHYPQCMSFNREIHSPSPSPYLALCAHVMPLWKPSSLQTTLASLMSTSSSQTVPQVPLCRTSTRPSFSLWPKPASRTLAAGARLDRPGVSGRASVHKKRSAKIRTHKGQMARIMIAHRWGFWNRKQQWSLLLNQLLNKINSNLKIASERVSDRYRLSSIWMIMWSQHGCLQEVTHYM